MSPKRIVTWFLGVGVLMPVVLLAQAGTEHRDDISAFRISPVIDVLEKGGIVSVDKEWAFIDMEHGTYPTLSEVRQRFDELADKRRPNGQLQVTPLVRVPMYGHEDPSHLVKQILDMGGMGVIFPQISTKAQAERAIRAMRYPPQLDGRFALVPGLGAGIRGYGGGGRHKLWWIAGKQLEGNEYLRRADLWPLNPRGEMFAVIMIESAEGVKNVAEITSVPGIGAIFIGPSDLGMSLGTGNPPMNTGQPFPETTTKAILAVGESCRKNKVICGIADLGFTGVLSRDVLSKQGFRFFQ